MTETKNTWSFLYLEHDGLAMLPLTKLKLQIQLSLVFNLEIFDLLFKHIYSRTHSISTRMIR
jgi:hypothetical protein